MGTRHLICVQYGDEYKIAQYGQWDGYPSGQGTSVLKFLKTVDMEEFKEKLKSVRFGDQKEIEQIGEKDPKWKEKFPEFSRDTGSKILGMVMNGVKTLYSSLGFAGDSLFCEYCYVIDLDRGMLEVYTGFNKKSTPFNSRFASEDSTLNRYTDRAEEDYEYEPVILKKVYSLDELPNRKKFLKDLEETEEEEDDEDA